jgi:hypothetical protein
MKVQQHAQQPTRSTAQDPAQSFRVVTQALGLRIKQGKCTFGKITGTDNSRVDSGNFVYGIHSGTIDQEGSDYKDIKAAKEAIMRLGNYIKGNNQGGDKHNSDQGDTTSK